MTETKIEKLCNKIQLMFFIIDALRDGEEVQQSILERAEKSLPKIQQLLKEIEEEKYECDRKAIYFGQFLLSKYDKEGILTEKIFHKFNEDLRVLEE